MHTTVEILNVQIDNLTAEELLERLDSGLLVTPNIDHLIKLQKDPTFYNCYQQASYVVCDSRIIYLLSKLLFPTRSLRAQITGSDFFPRFCAYHSQKQDNTSIFLLGGTEKSVQQAAHNINNKNQNHIVVGSYSPPFGFEHSEKETSAIIERINESGANVLAVGVGAPKQEKWICTHRHRFSHIKIFMAIGATIEFESGNLSRAPQWMTRVGLEWLYRLCQEPGRLAKRYLVEDMPFLWLLVKQRLGLYRNPWAINRPNTN